MHVATSPAISSIILLAVKYDIGRLNAARIALDRKLEQVTVAILSGGIEGLRNSLDSSTYVPSPRFLWRSYAWQSADVKAKATATIIRW
jgi:hypothetical protein